MLCLGVHTDVYLYKVGHLTPYMTDVVKQRNNATCCNMLQHAATHCNTLQHTATHRNTLQHTCVMYMTDMDSATQCNATCCNTLQHTATHCNTLQHTATYCTTASCLPGGETWLLIAASQVWHPTIHCNTLQHTATHCSTLYHSMMLALEVRHGF